MFFAKSEIVKLIGNDHGLLSIWNSKNNPCDKLSYNKETGLKKLEEYENDDIDFYNWGKDWKN